MSSETLETGHRRPQVAAGAVFVTGASGFVGRSVVRLLTRTWPGPVRCLVRTPTALPDGAEAVTGDLLDSDSYRAALTGVAVVIHLAAATGKQPAHRYVEVNVEGTRRLLAAAADAGVGRLVYVSSIAAAFADTRHYPYAQSKAAAEKLVAASGVPHSILRPTAVLGAGSPIDAAFERAASGPVTVLVGDGRASVQPIDVDQLSRAIVASACDREAAGRILELGGPVTFTYDQLLRRAGAKRIVHLPLAPVRTAVGLVERVAFPLTPVTAGQLTALAHDSVAREHPDRAGVAELRHECDVFCRYLLGSRPGPYVVSKYVDGHASIPFELAGELTDEDKSVLAFARRNPLCARIGDAWSRVASPHSPLRQKLVLLVAILECGETATDLTGTTPTGLVGAGVSVAGFALALAAGVILLAPRRMLSGRRA